MNSLKTLIVEDNPADVRLIEDALRRSSGARFETSRADSLAEAMQALQEVDPDVVLLDLGLPDSRGLESLETLGSRTATAPIIVLTGHDDESMALEALKRGAEDYLVKGTLEGELIARTVRYTVERFRLRQQLEASQRRERRLRELQEMDRVVQPMSVTGELYGHLALSKSVPDEFQRLVERYGTLLDDALDEQVFDVNHHLRDELASLADSLGFLRAGPRDVIEIHSRCIKAKFENNPPQKAEAYLEEGRMIVLELMGYLLLHYRVHATGNNHEPNRKDVTED